MVLSHALRFDLIIFVRYPFSFKEKDGMRMGNLGGQPPRALPRTMGESIPHPPLFASDRLKIKKIGMMADPSEILFGAGGRNRTDMELPPEDFESFAYLDRKHFITYKFSK